MCVCVCVCVGLHLCLPCLQLGVKQVKALAEKMREELVAHAILVTQVGRGGAGQGGAGGGVGEGEGEGVRPSRRAGGRVGERVGGMSVCRLWPGNPPAFGCYKPALGACCLPACCRLPAAACLPAGEPDPLCAAVHLRAGAPLPNGDVPGKQKWAGELARGEGRGGSGGRGVGGCSARSVRLQGKGAVAGEPRKGGSGSEGCGSGSRELLNGVRVGN